MAGPQTLCVRVEGMRLLFREIWKKSLWIGSLRHERIHEKHYFVIIPEHVYSQREAEMK